MTDETIASTSRVEIWLVRHGETEWAAARRHTGLTDVPLTEDGREQARSLASTLGPVEFGLVLSSPLARSLDTARLAGYGGRVVVDRDLVEWDYGRYEGLTTEEIRRQAPGWTIWTGGVAGGESADAIAARADRVIDRVVASGVARVLVFSHGHMVRVIAARWLGQPTSAGGWFALGVAGVSVLGWEHGNRVIQRWNVGVTAD